MGNYHSDPNTEYPLEAPDAIMAKKSHGTSSAPAQENLRFGCDTKEADKICNYNRHLAENSGSFSNPEFLKKAKEIVDREGKVTFYDSVTGKKLFEAPVGRTWEEFIAESEKHGWPSFRDPEVDWDNVRCLKNGETVSLTGSHLGHNIPDKKGKNRYCINLVSIAGNPE